MRTIEELVNMVQTNNNYVKQVQKLDISEEDQELLVNIFDDIKQGYIKSALHSLNWTGDTYIREVFAKLILKGDD